MAPLLQLAAALQLPRPWWQSRWLLFLVPAAGWILAVALWRGRERALRFRQRELEIEVAVRTRQLEAEKQELVAAREALRDLASRDELTQTWNRRAILEILEREFERARRQGDPLAVVLADLDGLKPINDRFGHLAGDAVLRHTAARLAAEARAMDSVGRYGGDEFLLILPGLAPAAAAGRLEQLRLAVAREPITGIQAAAHLVPTCSFGVAWLDPAHAAAVRDVLLRADTALYVAKAAGRNRVAGLDFQPLVPWPAAAGGREVL